MEFRSIGKSGLEASVVGLGCNNFGNRLDEAATTAVVQRALDVGITFFDTANTYGAGKSEEFLGMALGIRRQDVVIATKSGMPMPGDRGHRNSRRYLFNSVEQSLRRLKTDWIDLHQLHEPDRDTPIEETIRAVDDLITAGKIRYAGYSNFSAWQLVEAQWTGRSAGLAPFVSSQDEYSLLARSGEVERKTVLKSYGLGLLPYLPLASGLLTGKYPHKNDLPPGTRLHKANAYFGRVLTDTNFARVDALRAFAQLRGRTLLSLAFSWLAAQAPVASIIAGATTPDQVRANVEAVDWRLTDADLAEIDAITL